MTGGCDSFVGAVNLPCLPSVFDDKSLQHQSLAVPSIVDTNGDGCMDMDEFKALYGLTMEERGAHEENMMKAFNVFDKNGDGFISMDELRLVLDSLGLKQGRTMEDCRRMIMKVNVDGDGTVSFKEFKHMMKDGGFAALS
ncbi:hypothetical protein Ancab_008334 [Ancistrocladus abbreviatus]